MSRLRNVAQRIRHLPGLERMEGLWGALRAPYHRLLDPAARGVEVKVGGSADVRMPAEFAGASWEDYEPASVAAFARWVRDHPAGVVLDVGCSTGIFSVVALSAGAETQVVGFDPDLASLAAARRMCRFAGVRRLRLVHGFVGEAATEAVTLDVASAATEALIAGSAMRGDVGTTRYVCLGDEDTAGLACRRLDDLLAGGAFAGKPLLVKCDVEGAELLVLAGARELLARPAVELLLSVHPPALPQHGHSVAAVREFLERAGYGIECIAVDHEQHWWCRRAA
jgi:FkbM family methyltransferase